jgi:hemoglobin/transferrin/lactoferrin receptor protein
MDWRVTPCSTFTLAYQHVGQFEVPRTHTTVYAVPFAGSTVGTDLERDLDQRRDLVYAKYAWEDAGGLFPTGYVLASFHRQEETQHRLRTAGRLDVSGFTVETYGASVQLERPTCCGTFTFGVDAYHDEVRSFQDNFVNGAFTGSNVQGPLGDDGTYDLVGVYLQDRITTGCWEFVPGLHFTHAAAEADRVDNPLVAGSNPATPGNVIAVEDDWSALVGSLRARYRAGPGWNLYGGVSQAFRAPTLSDLTAFESTSVVETPTIGLDPDRYLGFELGSKWERRNFSANVAGWYLLLDDTIVRSPTGALIGGVPEVRKDNVGDGWLAGFEAEGAWRFACDWVAFGNLTVMDGAVDQFDTAQQEVRDDPDRLMPFTTLLGLRFEPLRGRFWAQAEWVHAEKADRLSLQNETDTQRIPPGGTPGYDVFHLRAGWRVSCDVDLLVALENVTDENYRIHGSGVSEPGRNLVLGLDLRF